MRLNMLHGSVLDSVENQQFSFAVYVLPPKNHPRLAENLGKKRVLIHVSDCCRCLKLIFHFQKVGLTASPDEVRFLSGWYFL